MSFDDSRHAHREASSDSELRGPVEFVRRARAAARRGELRTAVALYERALSVQTHTASLRRDEGLWELRFAGDALVLDDTKGVHYLARLVRQPRRSIPALLLASSKESRALAAAYDRLRAIECAISTAEEHQDNGRARGLGAALALHRETIDTLVERMRRSPAAESARVRVTQALRSTIERIARAHPVLGAHLDATIRTGAACTYAADPVLPSIAWDVRL